MSRHAAVWLASSLLALASSLFVASLLLGMSRPPVPIATPFNLVEVLFSLAFFAFLPVGAVIIWKRPTHTIGWLYCTLGFVTAIGAFSYEYAVYALLVRNSDLPGGEAMAWLSSWIWGTSILLFGLSLLLFPTGKPLSARWGWVLGIGAAAEVLLVAFGVSVWSLPGIELLVEEEDPPGGAVSDELANLGWALLVVTVLLSAISLMVRFRRARGVERQQLKWLAYPVTVILIVIVPNAFLPVSASWVEVVLNLAVLGIPVASGIAIVRHRLYDIDLIIRRTLVYGLLTVLLAGMYFGGVVLIQSLVRQITGQQESQLAIVASTLAIAALFQPLRGRIQGFIDKRFYRRRYDAARILTSFSGKLRDEVDLGRMSDELLGVVQETMQPAHVSLWLRSTEKRR